MVHQDHLLLFEVRNLTRGYPHSPSMLLYQKNLLLYKGDFLILQGKSGSGKSTLVKLLMRKYLTAPKMIRYKHEDISRFSLREVQLLRRRMGVVFQDYQLLEHHTVSENIALPLRINGLFAFQYHKKIDDLMSYFDIRKHAHTKVQELSGGEKQKVAIARALAHNPECIIADEPTGNLDRTQSVMIAQTLIDLHQTGQTVVFVTHDEHLITHIRQALPAAKLHQWGE